MVKELRQKRKQVDRSLKLALNNRKILEERQNERLLKIYRPSQADEVRAAFQPSLEQVDARIRECTEELRILDEKIALAKDLGTSVGAVQRWLDGTKA